MSKRDWYPYYAGFTERFVDAVLSEYLAGTNSVLDPWSGSGTTTLVCAKSGIPSTGIDVNPALTVVARARLTPNVYQPTILEIASQILETSPKINPVVSDDDPLGQWLQASSVARIRALRMAIHLLLAPDIQLYGIPMPTDIHDKLPTLACFFYTALFATVRDVLVQFQATNPMWFKSARSPDTRISPAWDHLADTFGRYARQFHERLTSDLPVAKAELATLNTATATSLAIPVGHFGGVLTSPPYATRVDYVKGTLPELAVLGLNESRLAALRAKSLGTPVVSHAQPNHYRGRFQIRIRHIPSSAYRASSFERIKAILSSMDEELHF